MVLRQRIFLWVLLFLAIGLNISLWSGVRRDRAVWMNVPTAPNIKTMNIVSLGDNQFAYRQIGVMLQNLGNAGGRSETLDKYDFKKLKDWFFLSSALDPKSVFIPYMAAYYFGAVNNPEKLRDVIEYLRVVGTDDQPRSWRWMAQAVHLARYGVRDMDLAVALAQELAASKDKTLPVWARQMPAFVLTAKGEKEAAYTVLINLLKSEAETLPPEEVNATRDYICTRILDPAQSKAHPLCQTQ
jgi:hypothetical protein